MNLTNTKNNSNNQFKMEIIWRSVILAIISHLISFYGIFVIIKGYVNLYTILFDYAVGVIALLSIAAGAHRLWSHRSYKAKWPLRLLLVMMNFLLYQNSVLHWARDHRAHHKYTDTDGDPYNSSRGVFFAHIGWVLVKKHPDVIEKGKRLPVSDLYEDPILIWQKKYYMILMPLGTFILPVVIPMYFWQESFLNAFCINILRLLMDLHLNALVNSITHNYGDRPYDKSIKPADSVAVGAFTLGEGLHNFHHIFPWDYRSAELGIFCFNITKVFIDCFAKIGWAYDLKAASPEMIGQRSNRTGDGSRPTWECLDKDQSVKEYKDAIVIN